MPRVLFVCAGNICRSPMAESVMAYKLSELGIDPAPLVDSAGVGGWHVGEEPDHRTRDELQRHGIPWVSLARQVKTRDFQEFDHLVAMDFENILGLQGWPGADATKISLLMDWCDEPGLEVPDPYYGGLAGFTQVFDMCDRACSSLIDRLFQ